MEFKFRAVDDRSAPYLSSSTSSPSLSSFSEQALGANYTTAQSFMPSQRNFDSIQLKIEKERIGQEFIVAENVSQQLRVLEEEMTRRLMMERDMPNPKDFYIIQLEIEKERIGQELIAAENVRQRLQMLQEEVTRKLMMEREMPMHRSSRRGISIDERLTMQRHSQYPLMHQLEDRLAFSGNRSLGFGHNVLSPILAESSDAATDKIKSASDFTQKDKLIMLARPDPNLFGAKGKVTTPPAGSQGVSLTSSKKPKEWSCALCQVSATSEQGLNGHLQGKKHKAKEAGLLRAQKVGNNPASQAKKSRKRIKLAESQDDEQPPKQKNLKAENMKKNVMQLAESVKREQAKKKFEFWCENCQVGTQAAVIMEAHKKGKKHIARLKESNQNGEAVSTITSPMIVKSSEPTEKPKKWSCALCQVSATSEQGLNGHLQGKKHKAKEAGLLTAQKVGNNPASQANKSRKQIELAESRDGAGSVMETKQQEKSSSQADKTVIVSDQKKEGVEDSNNENEQPSKQKNLKAENMKENVMQLAESVKRKQANQKFEFWCENCQVGTCSAVTMEAHKKGKKHMALLKESNQNGKAVSTMTSPMIVKSSEPTDSAKDIDVLVQEANKETTENVPTKNAKDADGVAKEANEGKCFWRFRWLWM